MSMNCMRQFRIISIHCARNVETADRFRIHVCESLWRTISRGISCGASSASLVAHHIPWQLLWRTIFPGILFFRRTESDGPMGDGLFFLANACLKEAKRSEHEMYMINYLFNRLLVH